jgi:hypothetical protein
MGVRHAKPPDGFTFEIEFDHHGGFVAHHRTIMAWLNRHDLRSSKVRSTTVSISDLNPATGEKTDVCVHAQISADNRFHMRGPPKSRRVDHALDTAGTRSDDLDGDTSNIAALGVFYRRKQRISIAHLCVLQWRCPIKI